MRTIDYISPGTIEGAVERLASGDASVVAGGTDLLIELRRPRARLPRLLVDISRIQALRGITMNAREIEIGALATHTQVSEMFPKTAPALAAAAASIGSPQIRNRGTIGGNIMNAATCADTVPALMALGARVRLTSRRGMREIPLADLFTAPYQTSAAPDELLTSVVFDATGPDTASAFLKLGRRNALSISRLNIAVVLVFDGERIARASIVPGSAFPVWKRITAAETMLTGQRPSPELFAAAGRAVAEEMIKETGRRWSTEYKEPVLSVLVRRALEKAACSPRHTAMDKVSAAVPSAAAAAPILSSSAGSCRIRMTVNGKAVNVAVPPSRTLLAVLRDDLGLTGTKCGCEIGECGACTVLLDGRAVNACLVLAPQADGGEIVTVEGLAHHGSLHPLQEAFLDHDAAHCGFCTPGMLLSAKALLDANPDPAEREIRTAISGNLCRCTGYVQITEAIADAASSMSKKLKTSHDH